jgi:DNA-damage-inducible protein J
VKIPSAKPVDMSALSEEEMNAELEKGYADMVAGRTKPAKQVFADIRKDYKR